MILLDSNLIIYITSGQYPELSNWFLDNTPSASAISLVEVLGYHGLKSNEKAELERFFSRLNVIYPTAQEFQRAIELRQKHTMSLGDALIAATALNHGLALATHNPKDFGWIKTLEVVDPLEE
jgi:predicted nucleic acid-binding protein